MTPQSKIDDIWNLTAKRNKLTLINILGIAVILIAQLVLVKYVSMDIMIFYPLLMLLWGAVFLTLIIKINIKIHKMCQDLSAEIRERNVRKP